MRLILSYVELCIAHEIIKHFLFKITYKPICTSLLRLSQNSHKIIRVYVIEALSLPVDGKNTTLQIDIYLFIPCQHSLINTIGHIGSTYYNENARSSIIQIHLGAGYLLGRICVGDQVVGTSQHLLRFCCMGDFCGDSIPWGAFFVLLVLTNVVFWHSDAMAAPWRRTIWFQDPGPTIWSMARVFLDDWLGLRQAYPIIGGNESRRH